MENPTTGKESFRPYARLISILGDQLISDKWVGVIELVKNSYDADAEDVEVRFLDFKNNYPQTIEIWDNGDGMTISDIKDKWLKPATPNKLNRKKLGKNSFTKKGRVIQGDKGVGRFAVYKLGDYVELFSKTKKTNEVYLEQNFYSYANDEFISEKEHEDKFLDEIENSWEINALPKEIKEIKGTLIRIKKLRNNWEEKDLEKLSKAFFQITPPNIPQMKNIPKDFNVEIFWNGEKHISDDYKIENMFNLAPFYYEGTIDENGLLEATYSYNRKQKNIKINLFDIDDEDFIKYDINKYYPFQSEFLKEIDEKKGFNLNNIELKKEKPRIGGFMFFVYGFNLTDKDLSKDDKEKLKNSSVFLYRDNVRVFPYGEKGDDWLNFSKYRAEFKAGDFFSYNDLLGYVFITQEENPDLRDSADREGLMNIDGKRDEFIALVSTALKIMKDEVDLDKKRNSIEKEKPLKNASQKFEESFKNFQKEVLKENNDKEILLKSSESLLVNANNYVKQVKEQLFITQELAGTGMVVEKTTHDTLVLLKNLRKNTDDIAKRIKENKITDNEIDEFFKMLQENLIFFYEQISILNPLLRRARRVNKDVSIKDTSDLVRKYFNRDLKEIDFKVVGKDFSIKTNTGLILQVLLNLMDNSIYWLNQTKNNDKKIILSLNEIEKSFIFSDNGTGINENYKDLIFEEFVTTKSEGRGLGLYIAKELLERISANISISDENILNGANIKVQFHKD